MLELSVNYDYARENSLVKYFSCTSCLPFTAIPIVTKTGCLEEETAIIFSLDL